MKEVFFFFFFSKLFSKLFSPVVMGKVTHLPVCILNQDLFLFIATLSISSLARLSTLLHVEPILILPPRSHFVTYGLLGVDVQPLT